MAPPGLATTMQGMPILNEMSVKLPFSIRSFGHGQHENSVVAYPELPEPASTHPSPRKRTTGGRDEHHYTGSNEDQTVSFQNATEGNGNSSTHHGHINDAPLNHQHASDGQTSTAALKEYLKQPPKLLKICKGCKNIDPAVRKGQACSNCVYASVNNGEEEERPQTTARPVKLNRMWCKTCAERKAEPGENGRKRKNAKHGCHNCRKLRNDAGEALKSKAGASSASKSSSAPVAASAGAKRKKDSQVKAEESHKRPKTSHEEQGDGLNRNGQQDDSCSPHESVSTDRTLVNSLESETDHATISRLVQDNARQWAHDSQLPHGAPPFDFFDHQDQGVHFNAVGGFREPGPVKAEPGQTCVNPAVTEKKWFSNPDDGDRPQPYKSPSEAAQAMYAAQMMDSSAAQMMDEIDQVREYESLSNFWRASLPINPDFFGPASHANYPQQSQEPSNNPWFSPPTEEPSPEITSSMDYQLNAPPGSVQQPWATNPAFRRYQSP
ncbi:hypothetical protein diail_4814 [Diaporthe ilicicola]|nr:hypothetical protein diail_4814 [Diaporthe ilicicola]